MKLIYIVLATLLTVNQIHAQGKSATVLKKETIILVSGETIAGTVAGIKEDSVSLATDYGVIRIPLSKITDKSREKLNIPEETDLAKMKIRIDELEELVASLREENANIRQTDTISTKPQATTEFGEKSKSAATGEAVLTYKLSTSGKRHNSRCRYFKSAGTGCGPNDGEPCKVCGG
jgi:hypothetical protein